MPDHIESDLHDIRSLDALTEAQTRALVSRGIVLIESFLAMGRANPEAMAALLDCSAEELSRLCAEAESLAPPLASSDAPPIPAFGLVPPSERTGNEEEGDEPCLE